MPGLELTDELAREYEQLFALAKIWPEHDFAVRETLNKPGIA